MDENTFEDDDEQAGDQGERVEGICETRRRELLAAVASAGALSTTGCLGITGGSKRQGGDIEFEGQTSTSGGSGSGTSTPGGETFDIEFVKEGATIPVAESEALLYAGLDEGWDLPYVCERGICGECTAKVDGDGTELVRHEGNDYLSEEQLQAGFVLTCTGHPTQEFAVETDMKDAADSFTGGGGDETATEEPGTATPEGEQYDIEFVKEGATIPVGENEALLYAGLDEGWDLPYECEHGVCGQCTAKVDGDGTELVEHDGNRVLSEEEIKEGYVLTCVGYPRDDFSIETSEQP
jgi:ferredoxin